MTIPTITALPDAPSRNDPANFSTKGDAFVAALPTLVTEANAMVTATNLATADVTTNQGLAAASAVAAAASEAAAAVTAGAAAWNSGTSYVTGNTVFGSDGYTYRCILASTNHNPTTDGGTHWTRLTSLKDKTTITGLLKGDGTDVSAATSGTDIKTVNGTTILGSGDIVIVSGISAISSVTASTTLTATPTLVSIATTKHGESVTLPDATTLTEGGPHFVVNNSGGYNVRILDHTGVLKGFLLPGDEASISLVDNATDAGVWAISNLERMGISAQSLSATIPYSYLHVVDLGSSRELLVGLAPNTYLSAVVHDRAANTFGSTVTVRATNVGPRFGACLQATDKVVVVSCPHSAATFEAVVLSVSGTTITVGTAATATLSANIAAFSAGCELIRVGDSCITAYSVATPACQIREITVSGTTPTISDATVLTGTGGTGGTYPLIIAGSSSVVIAVSKTTTHLYTQPFSIGGLSAGTGTDTNIGTMRYLNKLFPLGSRWFVAFDVIDTNAGCWGGIISLSGTTTTITTVKALAAGTLLDCIAVGNDKVLMLNDQTTNNANIVTDNAGTAEAGTAITITSATVRCCLYSDGTNVLVQQGTTEYTIYSLLCSGASPVASLVASGLSSNNVDVFGPSNAVGKRSPRAVYGASFAQKIDGNNVLMIPRVEDGQFSYGPRTILPTDNFSNGLLPSEVWIGVSAKSLMKVECVI